MVVFSPSFCSGTSQEEMQMKVCDTRGGMVANVDVSSSRQPICRALSLLQLLWVLPVENGLSMSHFLLDEHDMFTSFLWMAFGEVLGCNDPKQMNRLKGFAFHCLLEYLDSKFSPISISGFRTGTKLPSSMTKEILIDDIIDKVEEKTQFLFLIPDELIDLDTSHSLGKCMDFEIEEYQ
ncbi:hypothetical protein CQW23_29784 [Capsicum baccatum]|uniref:Uncharacterized protein n=1 Tax=Capsicum baccatum TaxID=33114 RepID=A0A2G2VC90_CAPBA|nr:hypothetical protein CQW23_29784 [Capsicum baccatum]